MNINKKFEEYQKKKSKLDKKFEKFQKNKKKGVAFSGAKPNENISYGKQKRDDRTKELESKYQESIDQVMNKTKKKHVLKLEIDKPEKKKFFDWHARKAKKIEKIVEKRKEKVEKKEQEIKKLDGVKPEGKKNSKKKKAKKDDKEEKDIRKLFKQKKKEKKKKLSAAERKRRLAVYLEKSGLETDQFIIAKRIFQITIFLTLSINALYIYFAVSHEARILEIILYTLITWTLGFVIVWGLCWIIFRIYLDLLMFRRKLSVEEVLPDFLQLTSANLRAGMPIDRALWFAVRPRFGVLAKEIEDIAKNTIAGQDLHKALLCFAKKYDSNILLRTVYLLNEGMDAGGDVAELLNKIALNVQEMRTMKKEMAANVTTYVIFISFASMVAAPFLFGLSSQLLTFVQKIAGDVAASGGSSSSSVGLTINISPDTIEKSNFQIFAYLSLVVSSVFSAIIVATIKKGNVKEGLQYIPIFALVSVLIYFFASTVLGALLGGFV